MNNSVNRTQMERCFEIENVYVSVINSADLQVIHFH